MNKFYLFVAPSIGPSSSQARLKTRLLDKEEHQVWIRSSSTRDLEEGDKLLMVVPKGGDYDAVLPDLQKIVLLDKKGPRDAQRVNSKQPVKTASAG